MNNEPSTVVLTFDSVEENVWCDYSNKSFLAVLVQGGICFFTTLGPVYMEVGYPR